MVLKAIDKVADTPIEIVAPSHGLIWRKDPCRIVNLYRQWAGYAAGKAERAITLVYGSMYGNTEMMVEAVARGITRTCVPLEIFDAAKTHPSYVLPSLWTRLGVVVGAPTYETGLFHPIAHLLTIAVSKGVKNRKALRFGSYGWAGGAQRELERIIDPAHWDLVDSFEFMGRPRREDLKGGEVRGEKFARIIENTQETSSCDGKGGP